MDEFSNPLLSIITVCKNSGLTIADTLNSVLYLLYKYKNVEYIIQDGISSDDTSQIINDRIKGFKNIKIFREKDNGIYDAMNKAMDKANGKYIYFLNSDDLLLENFSSDEFMHLLKKEYEIINCPLVFFQRPSNNIKRIWLNTKKQKSIINFFLSPYPPHPGFICKAELLKSYLFDEKYGTASDYHLIQKIMLDNSVSKKYYSKPIAAMALGGVSTRLDGMKKASQQIYLIHKELKINGSYFVRYFRNFSQYLFAFFLNKKLDFNRTKINNHQYAINVKLVVQK
tara:strand:+ start:2157 stop:3008 length:852 start_codon:yes stop_codon:yes gene_type:complete